MLSELLALINNVNCTDRKQLKNGCDFNPTLTPKERQKIKNSGVKYKPMNSLFANLEKEKNNG